MQGTGTLYVQDPEKQKVFFKFSVFYKDYCIPVLTVILEAIANLLMWTRVNLAVHVPRTYSVPTVPKLLYNE